jgi:hypothetical protein
MQGRARSAQTYKEPEEAMLIVIAVLSLLGAAASLVVPGGVLLAPVLLGGALLALTGGLGGLEDRLGAPARPADEPPHRVA